MSSITAEVTRPSTLDSTTEAPPRQPLPSASGNRPDRGVRRRKSSKKKTVASTGQSVGSTFAKQERQSDGLQQLTNIPGNIPAPATMNTGVRQDDGILELPDNVATDANPWQTMISDPTTLRQAFLLSQIFSRPEDRW